MVCPTNHFDYHFTIFVFYADIPRQMSDASDASLSSFLVTSPNIDERSDVDEVYLDDIRIDSDHNRSQYTELTDSPAMGDQPENDNDNSSSVSFAENSETLSRLKSQHSMVFREEHLLDGHEQ
jgi:hypothetical protein